MDAVRDAVLQVAHDRVGVGQVDGDLGAGGGEGLEAVVTVEGGGQFHVVGGFHGAYGLGAHPSLRAEDGHTQLAHGLVPSRA